jgi:arabinofuranosyltransferase
MSGLTLIARAAAVACVTVAFACSLKTSSLSVDGVRYFWLDDDQMISMRYARNLAHGDGPVWNPGERVEGYSNPGWTLVMAGLHVLPLPDAKMAVAVKTVSWLLACGILVLAERLARRIVPDDALAVVFVLLTLATCRDLLFWAVNGFDTTLLAAAFLFVVVRLLDERDRAPRTLTYLALGALPVIRSDGYYVWAGATIVALGVARDRRALLPWLAFSLSLPALHLGFRRMYYGQWLPNTFYVKVTGVDGRFASGVGYLKGFVAHYAALVPLALAAAWRRRGQALGWLLAPGLVGGGYVLYVGADMYGDARFLAFFVPLLLGLAAAGAVAVCRDSIAARAVVLAVAALSVLFQAGVNGPGQFLRLSSGNGAPRQSLVAALTVERNTRPDAAIAVVAAGVAPYFSHRRALDLMGLSDRYVARLPGHPGEPIGHAKYDVTYTLEHRPDVLLPLWNADYGDRASTTATRTEAIRTNAIFVDEYRDQALRVESPDGPCWLYVSAHSSAAANPSTWKTVTVAR